MGQAAPAQHYGHHLGLQQQAGRAEAREQEAGAGRGWAGADAAKEHECYGLDTFNERQSAKPSSVVSGSLCTENASTEMIRKNILSLQSP